MSGRREFLKGLAGGIATGFPRVMPSYALGRTGNLAPRHRINLILPLQPSTVTEKIGRVFARQVGERCDARITSADNAQLRVILAIEPGLGSEGFKITDDGNAGIHIIGNDERGLLNGVGKFLHNSRYDQGGFTPADWRGASAPQGSFRALYAATHFMNFYEAAPVQEVQSYIEDLGLWGANVVIVHFPTWTFKGFDDPAARRNLGAVAPYLSSRESSWHAGRLGTVPKPGLCHPATGNPGYPSS